MREGIRELIAYLEEASNGVLKVTNVVREDIARATDTTAETTEGADKNDDLCLGSLHDYAHLNGGVGASFQTFLESETRFFQS